MQLSVLARRRPPRGHPTRTPLAATRGLLPPDASLRMHAAPPQAPPCRRVLYVDVDVHHGDAVEEAFATTPRVLTVRQAARALWEGWCSGSVR